MTKKLTQLELQLNTITQQLCDANTENAFLRAKLAERDHLARRLIKRVNKTISPRKAEMERAKREAQLTGTVVKANHV